MTSNNDATSNFSDRFLIDIIDLLQNINFELSQMNKHVMSLEEAFIKSTTEYTYPNYG